MFEVDLSFLSAVKLSANDCGAETAVPAAVEADEEKEEADNDDETAETGEESSGVDSHKPTLPATGVEVAVASAAMDAEKVVVDESIC